MAASRRHCYATPRPRIVLCKAGLETQGVLYLWRPVRAVAPVGLRGISGRSLVGMRLITSIDGADRARQKP